MFSTLKYNYVTVNFTGLYSFAGYPLLLDKKSNLANW